MPGQASLRILRIFALTVVLLLDVGIRGLSYLE